MAKTKNVNAVTKLVAALADVKPEDRQGLIQAAYLILGDTDIAAPQAQPARQTQESQRASTIGTGLRQGEAAAEYFNRKKPKTKTEELAVAARYREETEQADRSTAEEFRTVFGSARLTFDANNYRRDIDNARAKGLFTRGTGRTAQLSNHGQLYVDALPDREALKALGSGRGKGRSRGKGKGRGKRGRAGTKKAG